MPHRARWTPSIADQFAFKRGKELLQKPCAFAAQLTMAQPSNSIDHHR
jgi:hypothetical protein